MNVMFMLLLACLGSPAWGLPLNLRKVAQIDQIISSMKANGSYPGKNERRNQVTESEAIEFSPPVADLSEDSLPPEPAVAELDFEHIEIRNLIDFTEFRLDEINALITECVDSMFTNNPFIDGAYVRDECAGSGFQILYANYHEALKRIKTTLLELMRIKLQQLDDLYYDEVIYFIDLVENLVDGDYHVGKTLAVAKRSAKYYSSPRLFESVVAIAKDEIDAFDEVHQNLANKRRRIQMEIEARINKEEKRRHVKPLKESSPLVDKQFEDWEWEEDDIPPMEEDEESEPEHEEEEEEVSEQDEEHSEDEAEHEAEQQGHQEEEEEEAEQEEEPEPEEPEPEDTPMEQAAAVRPTPQKIAPSLPPAQNVGKSISGALGGGVDFAAKSIDKVLESPAMKSFFNTLSSSLEKSMQQNQAAEAQTQRRRDKV
jgi:hypothetical protein